MKGPRELRARDMMLDRVHVLYADEQCNDAIDVLVRHGISGAPVVDDDRRLLGVLTERDCIEAMLATAYEGLPSTTVDRAMTTGAPTVAPDTDFLTIAHIFQQGRVRRLPVLDEDGVLLGLVTRRTFLRSAVVALRPRSGYGPSPLYLSATQDGEAMPPA